MIKIGTLRNTWSKFLAVQMQQTLAQRHYESQIMYFQTLTEVENALLCGEVDLHGIPLTSTAPILRKGLVIAGLSSREDIGMSLTSRRNENADNLLGLPKGAKVGVHTIIQQYQMQRLGFDVIPILINDSPDTLIKYLLKGEFDACITPKRGLSLLRFEDDNYITHHFHPREFVPEVGQGVGAVLCAEDNFIMRQFVKQFHNSQVAEVCNVERTLLKMYHLQRPTVQVAAFCERDLMSNYHLYAVDTEGGKVRISSTTTFELAENAFERLRKPHFV